MKIYIYILPILIVLLLVPIAIYSRPASAKPNTFLVFDHSNVDWHIAKRFRSDYDMEASASGQFSAAELKKLLGAVSLEPQRVWIVDLRQESHGFINGIPISWYAKRNSGNLHKSAKKIEAQERKLLNLISRKKMVTIYNVKKLAEGDVAADSPVHIQPKLVQSEHQLVTSMGANYYRLYVLDHHHPDNETVDAYVQFIKDKVRPQDWLHFHCRGGKGRSSTFIAMLDMIRHASTTSFTEIMERQAEMGNAPLSQFPTSPEKLWKADAARERYEFLQEFYAYASDPNGLAKQSWSAWLKQKKVKNTKNY